MKPLKASDRVVLTTLADGTGVLLHLDTKFYFTLNKSGVAVWNCLEMAPTNVLDLTELLVARFEVAHDQARADLNSLLVEMRNEQLIDELA